MLDWRREEGKSEFLGGQQWWRWRHCHFAPMVSTLGCSNADDDAAFSIREGERSKSFKEEIAASCSGGDDGEVGMVLGSQWTTWGQGREGPPTMLWAGRGERWLVLDGSEVGDIVRDARVRARPNWKEEGRVTGWGGVGGWGGKVRVPQGAVAAAALPLLPWSMLSDGSSADDEAVFSMGEGEQSEGSKEETRVGGSGDYDLGPRGGGAPSGITGGAG